MLLTRKLLDEYLDGHFITIPEELKKELLETLGTQPYDENGRPLQYSEQDIFEQVRKAVQPYSR